MRSTTCTYCNTFYGSSSHAGRGPMGTGRWPCGPFTKPHASAPRLQLNVANAVRAHLVTRACECPLGEAGLTLHVTDVGSDVKLTSEGLNYSVAGLAELLEATLPARFGGGVGDYQ